MDKAFAARRAALARRLPPRSALLVASGPEHIRNGDSEHKFRQDSDVLYLSGFAEPGALVCFRPDHATTPFVLFVRERNPREEVWTGRRAGVEGARSVYGADAAFSIEDADARLPELLAGVEEIHYPIGRDEGLDARVVRLVGALRRRERSTRTPPPLRLVDLRASLHEERLIKGEGELATLRRAAAITAEAHTAAMRAARPGVRESEIEALIDYTFRRRGGTAPGYATIVGGGRNATILHYVENSATLAAGTLLLIDAGCEVDGYTADVTRTFPVGGRFTEPQRRLYDAVLEIQLAAIAAVGPGATTDGIHAQVLEGLTRKMVELELLRGAVPELVEKKAYERFYMHRTSHWLGLDVHDAGRYYGGPGDSRPLEPGMVLTIEPGLYVAEDDTTAPPALRGLGVRIEDDILVTATGHENLTAAVPKSVAEIEALTTA